MEVRSPHTTASRLARAEMALREQWASRNLYLPRDRITPNLAAQKRNTRSAVRWYVGEIRALRLHVPRLDPPGSGHGSRTTSRGGTPGYPVQVWTRAVATSRATAARASWIPIPGFDVVPDTPDGEVHVTR
jgi:hypothetical protein